MLKMRQHRHCIERLYLKPPLMPNNYVGSISFILDQYYWFTAEVIETFRFLSVLLSARWSFAVQVWALYRQAADSDGTMHAGELHIFCNAVTQERCQALYKYE